jgi:hypothetical protein
MRTISQDSPSLLKQLFPNPTGTNGWEVVCDVADRLAGDLRKFEEFVAARKQSIADVNRYFSDSRVRKIVTMLLETERMNYAGSGQCDRFCSKISVLTGLPMMS